MISNLFCITTLGTFCPSSLETRRNNSPFAEDETRCCRTTESVNRYKCELCPGEFFTKAVRDLHVARHSEMMHVCPSPCGVMFPDFTSLQKHHVRHHGSKIPETKKDACKVDSGNAKAKEQYTETNNKKITDVTHKPKIQWPKGLTCGFCKRKFTSKDRKQHHEAHHDLMLYKCFCGSMFLHIETHPLVSHCKKAHGIKLRMKQCTQFQLKKAVPKLRVVKNTVTNRWSSSFAHSFNGGKLTAEKCHLCNRRFNSTLDSLYHMKYHRDMIYECPKPCGNQFIYFHRLKSHRMDIHKVFTSDRDKNLFQINPSPVTANNRKETLSCNICKREFRYKETLEYHLSYHDKMIYKCPKSQCTYLYSEWDFFRKHVFYHGLRVTKNNEEQYKIKEKCPVKQNNMVSSRIFTKKVNCAKLNCQLCGRRFLTPHNKDFHEANHDKMVYRCPDPCGYMYMKLHILNKHSISRHGKRLSGKRLHRTQMLRDAPHLDSFTRTSNNVLLSPCSNQREDLKTSAKTENLKCHICRRRFHSTADKGYHLGHHTDIKYKCPDPCGNQFLNFECMRKHSWNSHGRGLSMPRNRYLLKSGKKPSEMKNCKSKSVPSRKLPQCNKCHRQFLTVQNRNEHLQRHEEMQFQCPEPCGSMFLQFSALKKHVSNRHPFKLYQKDRESCRIKESDHKDPSSILANSSLQPPRRVKTKGQLETQSLVTMVSGQLQNGARDHSLTFEETPTVVSNSNRNTKQMETGQDIVNGCTLETNIYPPLNSNLHEHKMLIYECPMIHPACNTHFATFYELQDHCDYNHKIRLRKEDEKTYRIMKSPRRKGKLGLPKCRHCGRVFKTEERRDQHMKNHDQLRYRCWVNQCGYLFDDLLELRFHWRDAHKLKFSEVDPKNYAVVNYCRDKSFNAKNGNEETERQSNNIQEKVVTEDECETETDKNNNPSVAMSTESSFNTFNAKKSNEETEKQCNIIQEKVVTKDECETETDKNNNQCDATSTESTFVTVLVMEKDGDQVGTVDVHATKDGAAVQCLMTSDRNETTNHDDLSPSKEAINLPNVSDQVNYNNQEQCEVDSDLKNTVETEDGVAVQHLMKSDHNERTNHEKFSPSRQGIKLQSYSDQANHSDQEQCEIEMQNIVEYLQQDKNGDSLVNNVDRSMNVSTPIREDTKKLFAENSVTRNDGGMMLTDELLNSSFDVFKPFLDTDLLNETFTSDIFDTLLTSEDNALLTGDSDGITAKDSNELKSKTECTLQISNCFSLATNISDGTDPYYCSVLGDHSYSRQQTSPQSEELADTACKNDVTPTSRGPNTFSSLLDGVSSDVDNCPDLPHTKNTGSTTPTPAVDVSVDSGVGDLNSIHPVTVDTVTSHAGLPQRKTVELGDDNGSVVKTERSDEKTRYFTHYIPTALRSKAAKVMFSQACVILFTGGVSLLGCLLPGGREGGSASQGCLPPCLLPPPPPRPDTPHHTTLARHITTTTPPPPPLLLDTPRYDQSAVSTHPTGMHSCLFMHLN